MVLVALGLSWTATAESPSPLREGNWEVTTKMKIAGMNMEAPPMKQTVCVTADMLKDPASMLGRIPGADCKMTDYKLEASSATYKLTCTQPVQITGVGEIKYSGGDGYTGTLVLDMGSGQTVTLNTDAKRIGDCPK
jgi:hypothetical protein